MNSPEDLLKSLLAGAETSLLKEEVSASVRLDRLICTLLAEGYIPPPAIIVLRSESHSDPSVAAAVRQVMDHSSLVYHTLASALLMENIITLETVHRALINRATDLCKGYPAPAQTIVKALMEDLLTTLEVCRKTIPKISFK